MSAFPVHRASAVLAPGATVGILGGGQLGRMIAMAAAKLGLRVHVYCPETGPAFDVASARTIAPYEDEASLRAFAAAVDVVTYEFENVPARTASLLATLKPVRPGVAALAASQDRLAEKTLMASLGILTAPYADVGSSAALAEAVARIGRPSILKTRRFGYDGKGQIAIREDTDPAAAFDELGDVPCILEGLVPFTKEVSVVAARGLDGSFAAFDVCENRHEHHILDVTMVPARIEPATAAEAIGLARTIADALDYVGVLAVEFFLTVEAGREIVRVNEIAPRVHNSGHWTLDGAVTSQFEQHVRAICGWPLGATTRHGKRVEMRNLIGVDALAWHDVLAGGAASLHLYGKAAARPGRKMGHATTIFRD